MGADNLKLCFGAAGATDSYIRWSGSNLELYDSVAGLKTLTELITSSTMTLDEVFDQGKIIDGAETSVANACQIGGVHIRTNVAGAGCAGATPRQLGQDLTPRAFATQHLLQPRGKRRKRIF